MRGRRLAVRAVLALSGVVLLMVGSLPASAAERSAEASTATSTATPAASGQLLSPDPALYPRAVRLEHNGDANGQIIASATTFTDRGGEGGIFSSTDDGASFEQIASIPVAEHNGQPGLCCGTLFELPQRVGQLAEGTLLYAASAGQEAGDARRMSLDIWQSPDAGRTWSYLSACATAGNAGGLWEPEFSVDAGGRLVCHYADETDPLDGSQKLVRVVSTDGVNWGDRQVTVRNLPESTRPGMPVVRTRPDGTYVMVHEICGQPGESGKYDCAAYLRTSPDGWDWGDPDARGTLVESVDGRYFTHAPTVALADDGTLLAIGQQLRDADGSIAAGSGRTVFTSGAGGTGPWTEIAAPVEVPDPANKPCPNYSSSLTPLPGGTFLEIANDYADDGACLAYFATGAIG